MVMLLVIFSISGTAGSASTSIVVSTVVMVYNAAVEISLATPVW